MKKFYLIRHAQSESNAGLNVRPNHEIALTELGKTQADSLSDWLMTHVPTPTQVFVSTYIRTHETARPYLDKIGVVPVMIEPLREFNYLDYDHIKDLTYPQIITLADEYWTKADTEYTDSPATDSFTNLIARVKAVRDEFRALPDGTYVVFTHGMWLGMLMWQLLHSYHGTPCPRVFNMTAFRQFELAIRPKNCEVFALLDDGTHQAMTKVRTRYDDL